MINALIQLRNIWDLFVQYRGVRFTIVLILSSLVMGVCYFLTRYFLNDSYLTQFGFIDLPLILLILSQLFFIYVFKVNRGLWRYSSVTDLFLIIKMAIVGVVFNGLVAFTMGSFTDSIRFILLNHVLFIMALGGIRLMLRAYYHFEPKREDVTNVLIIGAGGGGDLACRRFSRIKNKFKVIGFLDDDENKKNRHIHGYKVLGTLIDLADIIRKNRVDEIVVAIPTAKPNFIRDVAKVCFENKVSVKVMHPPAEMENGDEGYEIRKLRLEDLLYRDKITVDLKFIRETYSSKKVLVTGAAGSIGEELVKQVAATKPSVLYLLDQAESPLYFLLRDCETRFPDVKVVPLLCDITDKAYLEQLFILHRPEIVLHAAAYKHVPLLEDNLYQAMSVNVEGTRSLCELSEKYKVERFVFISTDKAVNPTNILGVTKRMAELICKTFHEKSQTTNFIAVRFGNVIGSQGSVIPLFTKQIQQGGPVTVTDLDIKRYFMMIPEAVQLVLFASVLGSGGEIFVLDMGKQIKIIDLATNMIRLCGFEPNKDIKIEYTGLRPGEKLYEELYDETEKVCATKHPKINMAIGISYDHDRLMKKINTCILHVKQGKDKNDLTTLLTDIVGTYQVHSLLDAS